MTTSCYLPVFFTVLECLSAPFIENVSLWNFSGLFYWLIVNVRLFWCCNLLSCNFFILAQHSISVNIFFFSNCSVWKRRRRDLNPRAAINDLLPFQGSPFGLLGTSPSMAESKFFYFIFRRISIQPESTGFTKIREIRFTPIRNTFP